MTGDHRPPPPPVPPAPSAASTSTRAAATKSIDLSDDMEIVEQPQPVCNLLCAKHELIPCVGSLQIARAKPSPFASAPPRISASPPASLPLVPSSTVGSSDAAVAAPTPAPAPPAPAPATVLAPLPNPSAPLSDSSNPYQVRVRRIVSRVSAALTLQHLCCDQVFFNLHQQMAALDASMKPFAAADPRRKPFQEQKYDPPSRVHNI